MFPVIGKIIVTGLFGIRIRRPTKFFPNRAIQIHDLPLHGLFLRKEQLSLKHPPHSDMAPQRISLGPKDKAYRPGLDAVPKGAVMFDAGEISSQLLLGDPQWRHHGNGWLAPGR